MKNYFPNSKEKRLTRISESKIGTKLVSTRDGKLHYIKHEIRRKPDVIVMQCIKGLMTSQTIQ